MFFKVSLVQPSFHGFGYRYASRVAGNLLFSFSRSFSPLCLHMLINFTLLYLLLIPLIIHIFIINYDYSCDYYYYYCYYFPDAASWRSSCALPARRAGAFRSPLLSFIYWSFRYFCA